MATQRHINTFTNGMSIDKDPALQESTTYLFAKNGRIVYNQNGTLSFQNAKGNISYVNLTSGYMPIGSDEANGGEYLIIFSKNDTTGYSEIGFITEDAAGSPKYQVAFNDYYDPYGNKLNFSLQHQIKASTNYENDDNITTYWDDDYNESRAFNIMAGKPYQWWTNPPTTYPTWYSVHAMATMLDVNHVIPQYNSTLENAGQKLVGRYQYCYRLTHKNGYATPYSPVTNLITLTSDAVDNTNWCNYQMQASGGLSNKAIVIDVNGLDTRFSKIELVCVYWETDTAPTNAYICQTATISGANMTFTDTDNTGTTVSLDSIVQTYVDIRRAKTNAIYRNALHRGNVVLNSKLTMDTTSCIGYPSIRNMLSDTTTNPTTLPFTHQNPVPTSDGDYLRPILYTGTNPSVIRSIAAPIKHEYINYKGTQFSTRFTGYFRGEVYPFAVVLWDMKGMPMYANHIADIELPQQYNTAGAGASLTYNAKLGGTTPTSNYVDAWASLSAGTISVLTSTQDTFKPTGTGAGGYVVTDLKTTAAEQIPLRTMGLMFDGLDLTNVLYDSNGKQQISGFQIVRMDRYGNIAFQGVSQSAYTDSAGTAAITIAGVNWTPFHDGAEYIRTFDNSFDHSNNESSPLIYVNSIVSPDLAFSNGACLNSTSNPNTAVNTNYRLHTLGAAYGYPYGSTAGAARVLYYTPGSGVVLYYSKPYLSGRIDAASGGSSAYYGNGRSLGSGIFSNGYYALGQTQIQNQVGASSGNLLGVQVYRGNNTVTNSEQSCLGEWTLVTSNTIKDWNVYANTNTPTYTCNINPVYPIVNYELGITAPAITQTELENRIYKNIGHFVPITPQLISDCTSGGGRVIVNSIEVFGGDCYLDYYATTRQIPFQNNNGDFNTGRSIIAPIESKYNFTMRLGNTFDKVGANRNSNTPFPAGYYISNSGYAVEPFNINSTLLAEDNWRLYYPKPDIITIHDNQPTLHYFSATKVVNELIDSFRVFQPNNFDNVDGKYGEIIRMDLLFNDLYLFQPSGFSRARFNERALVATSVGDLSTGSGVGLQGYDYVNKASGLQLQFAFCKTDKAFYWVDCYKGKLCKFSQAGWESPSDVSGEHNYFIEKTKGYWRIPPTYFDGITTYNVGQYNAITPEWNYVDNACGINKISTLQQKGIGGINLAYDYKNDSVIINFSNVIYNLLTDSTFTKTYVAATKETIEYNETTNKFTTYHDIYPNILMQFKRRLLMNYSPMTDSSFSLNSIYLHDEGKRGQLFGTNQPTILRFAVAPQLGLTKYFDNGRLNVNGNAVSLLSQVVGYTQNLPNQTIILNNSVVDNRPIWLEGELRYPIMQKGQVQRLRDKYVILEFTITNDGSDTVVDVTSHETLWRPSAKI